MKCEDRYVRGPRQGEPCPYESSEVVAPAAGEPFVVCGYHARAYMPERRYPLWCSLERIRAWRMENIDAIGLREQLKLANSFAENLRQSLEAALTATGDHHQLPDGYCLDCGGGCILPAARENTEQLRQAAFAGPSPFQTKGGG